MVDSILDGWSKVVRSRGDQFLVQGGESWTAAEIDSAASAISARLDDVSPERARPLALSTRSGGLFLAGLIGGLRAMRPVLLLDSDLTGAERDAASARFGAQVCVGDGTHAAWAGLRPLSPAAEPPALPRGATVIKMSSGTTGVPCGIATTSDALAADEAALFSTMELRETDRLLAAVPLGHSYGLSSLALPAIVRGLPLVMTPDDGPFTPLHAARTGAATVFPTTPAWLHALSRLAEPVSVPETLRLVISAGAPLDPEAAARAAHVLGRRVHAFYGASEAGGICYDRTGEGATNGTVGEPVEGVRLTLLPVDPSLHGAAEAGQVIVRSPAVASGALPPDPARLSGGRFAASDIAVLHGAELRLLGRLDDLIIVRGRKVSPVEIESILREMDGVLEAVAVPVTRPEGGDPVLRAVVACAPGRLTPREILAWCRSRLAGHKQPRSVVVLPVLPRTPRGKIDRRRLSLWDAGATES